MGHLRLLRGLQQVRREQTGKKQPLPMFYVILFISYPIFSDVDHLVKVLKGWPFTSRSFGQRDGVRPTSQGAFEATAPN